jgi:drug/metabolite transporter (DMT)-like permease
MSHDTQPQAFIPRIESFPLFPRPASDATFLIQVAELALLLLTIFWGSTFLVTKRLLETTSPGIFLSLRFALAALTLAIIWRVSRPKLTAGIFRDGIRLGSALAAGFLLQTIGLRYTSPTRSGFLTGLTVLFVPLVARFGLGKPVARAVWVGATLAIVGLAVMTRPWSYAAGGAAGAALLVGDGLTVGCAIAFAAHITWTSEWALRHPIAPFLFVQVALVTVVSLVLTVVWSAFEAPRVGPPATLAAVVAYTGALMTAGAIFLQMWAQRHTTAVRAALIFACERVFAALFAAWLGGDRIALAEWVGGGIILAGVVYGELPVIRRGTAASDAR